jgi:hypothetical protein
MAFTSAPAPIKDDIATPARKVAQTWIEYFASRDQAIDRAPSRAQTVTITGQGASIGVTPIPGAALAEGLYRASYHVRVTRAATTSSSITPAITFTSGGVSCTHTGTAVTGNTTGSVGSGTFLLKIDSSTPVSYSAVYASVGGTSMQFELSITLERIDA